MVIFRQELAIDLGTANTVIVKEGTLFKAVARGTCLALKGTVYYPFLMQ